MALAAAAAAPARGCAPAPFPASSAAVPGATACLRVLVCGCATVLVAMFLQPNSTHQTCHGRPMSGTHSSSDSGCELASSAQPVTVCRKGMHLEKVCNQRAVCHANMLPNSETSNLPLASSVLSLSYPSGPASASERRHLHAWKLWLPPWPLCVLHLGVGPLLH